LSYPRRPQEAEAVGREVVIVLVVVEEDLVDEGLIDKLVASVEEDVVATQLKS
jgi:hypothetical protein